MGEPIFTQNTEDIKIKVSLESYLPRLTLG